MTANLEWNVLAVTDQSQGDKDMLKHWTKIGTLIASIVGWVFVSYLVVSCFLFSDSNRFKHALVENKVAVRVVRR